MLECCCLAPVSPMILNLSLSEKVDWRPIMSSPISHAIQAIIAGGAFLTAQTVTEPDLDWLQVVERLGLAVALVVFFVWTSWQREQRMGKRIDWLEKQGNTFSSKLAALTELVTEALRRDTDIVEEAVQTLESRPCIAFENQEQFAAWLKQHKEQRAKKDAP